MRSIRSFVSIIALFAAVVANARVPVGTLTGHVLDARGNAVPNASVTIQTSIGQHPHATYTDTSGRFAFVRFEAGEYDLRAFSRGAYSDWAKRVFIGPNKTSEITLHLKPVRQ